MLGKLIELFMHNKIIQLVVAAVILIRSLA